jgi:hypothetical protein
MNFNRHLELEGQHAFLSASKYHWVNYEDEKLAETYRKYLATQRGTRLHELACQLIRENIVLPRTKKTFNMYVNDAIGFKMKTEQPLFYSENCFGTADAISFKKNFLRIHDLKTGETPSSIKQLEIYTAIFCLEYDINPTDIQIELRLYQSDDVVVNQPVAEDILYIMDKIIKFDKEIDKIKMSE